MDGQAYIDQRSWQVLLDDMGFNQVQLRDNRYDAVIHLVTAANGADKHYNLENVARYENTLQKAIETDEKLQQAWAGHPYWIKIDNRCEFKEKIQRVGQALLHLVGLPSSLTFYKKFLLT